MSTVYSDKKETSPAKMQGSIRNCLPRGGTSQLCTQSCKLAHARSLKEIMGLSIKEYRHELHS